MVVAFCDRLGWNYFKNILDGFSERIAFGVRRNLTELVRIAGIDASRARAFHAANITTVAALANSTTAEVVKVLRAAVPFIKCSGNDLDYNRWLRGEKLMSDTEAAQVLIERAKDEVFASIREIGLFAESQISLLLKKSSKDLYRNTLTVSANDDFITENYSNKKDDGKNLKQSCCIADGNRKSYSQSGNVGAVSQYTAFFNGHDNNTTAKDVGNLTYQMRRCSLSNVTFEEMNIFSNMKTDVEDSSKTIINDSCLPGKTIFGTTPRRFTKNFNIRGRFGRKISETLAGEDYTNEICPNVIENFSPVTASISMGSCGKRSKFPTGSPVDDASRIEQKRNLSSLLVSNSGLKLMNEMSTAFICYKSDFSDTASDSFLAAVNTQIDGDFPVCQQLSSTITSSAQQLKCSNTNSASKDQSDYDFFTCSLENAVTGNFNTSELNKKERISNTLYSSSLVPALSPIAIKSTISKKQLPDVHDHSYDLFDPAYSTQSPELVAVKRVHDVEVKMSPLTPSTRSPLIKQSRYSESLKNFDGLFPLSKNSSTGFSMVNLPSRILDVCSSSEQWKNFITESKEWKEIGFSLAFDFSSNYSCKNLIGISLCSPDGFPAFISLNDSPVYGDDDEENQFPSFTPLDSIPISERIKIIKTLFCSTQPKYVFNILEFSRQLYQPPFDHCTAEQINNFKCLQMLSFVANYRSSDGSNPCHSLSELLNKLQPNMHLDITQYRSKRIKSSIDSFLCVKLFSYLYSLARSNTSKYSIDLELKAVELLSRMEAVGIPFSTAVAKKMSDSIKRELSSLESKAYEMCGVSFNFDSPSEIAHVLFVRLKLPPIEGTVKTAKRHFSTNKAVLQKLAAKHEIAKIILKWRKMNTALSLSLSSLLKFCSNDDRIHALFFPYTLTGRVQSTNPNVQNVQKSEVVDGLSVRSLFIASSGKILIAADYKQLEMRILAHFCCDPELKRLFYSKCDFFQTMVRYWNENPLIKVKVDRQKVKQLCYGLIYGMGAATLSEQLGVSKSEAKSLIDAFFKQFPKVRVWIDETVEKCRSQEVRTLLGRKCSFLERTGLHWDSESRIDRRAGSASEIFKIGLVNLEESLKRLDARVVMQVHDEVIVEARNQDVKEVSQLITDSMCGKNLQLNVPLEIKISLGNSWGEMEEMPSNYTKHINSEA